MTAAATDPDRTPDPVRVRRVRDRTDWVSAIPFFLVHLAPLGAFFVVVTWQDWVLCAVLYVTRMFCITAGYHRYFSHRSYKMGRVAQFLMAFGGTTAVQKGPLWWASHHRIHHRYTDLDDDVHSPRDGFWWSHVGWILSTKYKDTDLDGIKDFAAYPELRWLERHNWIGPWLLAIACFLLFGWGGLFIGFFLSTVLLWHGTFLVNSMAHLMGRRRYATPDTSRNSFVIAVITGGEGWHNNHHYLPASVRQGFRWWEYRPDLVRAAGPGRAARRPRPEEPSGPPARPGPGARRGLRHRHVPLLLGAGGQGHRRAHRRPECPARWPRRPRSTDDRRAGRTPVRRADRAADSEDQLSTLAGLISRALESADQLAASTRRTRRAPRWLAEPDAPTAHRNDPGAAAPGGGVGRGSSTSTVCCGWRASPSATWPGRRHAAGPRGPGGLRHQQLRARPPTSCSAGWTRSGSTPDPTT